MTAACRNNGTVGEAICAGCNVVGFGKHRCVREAVRLFPHNQAEVTTCTCQVDESCAGYKPHPARLSRVGIPDYLPAPVVAV